MDYIHAANAGAFGHRYGSFVKTIKYSFDEASNAEKARRTVRVLNRARQLLRRKRCDYRLSNPVTKKKKPPKWFFLFRSDWIRTSGFDVPNVALYQTEPHPEIHNSSIISKTTTDVKCNCAFSLPFSVISYSHILAFFYMK